jgi:spore coat protein U-like protein
LFNAAPRPLKYSFPYKNRRAKRRNRGRQMSNSQARLVRALIFASLFPLCFAYLLPISRPAMASTASPSGLAQSVAAYSSVPAQAAPALGNSGDTITVAAMR